MNEKKLTNYELIERGKTFFDSGRIILRKRENSNFDLIKSI